jgi:hypothetical protein
MKIVEHCLICKHQLILGCKAFPDGVPMEYSEGIKIHNKIIKGQVGTFIFEEGKNDFDVDFMKKN